MATKTKLRAAARAPLAPGSARIKEAISEQQSRLATAARSLEVYLDAFNAYDRENRGAYQYAATLLPDGVKTVRTDSGEEMLPFLPMFGLRYRF